LTCIWVEGKETGKCQEKQDCEKRNPSDLGGCSFDDDDECYEYNGKCFLSCPSNMEPEYSDLKKTGKCVETECSKKKLSEEGCGDDCFRYVLMIIFVLFLVIVFFFFFLSFIYIYIYILT
jgi:hypothetical protein